MQTQKLAVISNKGLGIIDVIGKQCQISQNDESSTVYEAIFDKSGRYLCWCSSTGTFLLELQTNRKLTLSNANKFRKISFSPKGSFVSLFSINYNNSAEDNVVCYKTCDGSLLHSFKYSNSGQWAPQWSGDETVCMRVHKSEVHFHTTDNMAVFHGKITLKGLEAAAMATCTTSTDSGSNSRHLVAVYVKGAQGMPHMVKIYQYPNLTEPINNRSFFKASDVYLHWSPSGRALLFLVHTEDTKVNYYGENSLYFMSSDIGGETAVVPMPKSETNNVQNVDWQPLCSSSTNQKGGGGERFLVTYGNPVHAAVYNIKCQLLYHIDAPNRNVCHFSNCGAMIAMMGAGSVRSSIQLWGRGTGASGSEKLFGELDIEDVNRVCWSGNDRYLVSATVSPALRVNNGLMIWDVENGELIADKSVCSKLLGEPSEIYNVLWQPDSAHCNSSNCKSRRGTFYFDNKCRRYKEKPVTTVSTTYVPPHLRNRVAVQPVAPAAAAAAAAGGHSNNKGDGGVTTVNNIVNNNKINTGGPSMKFTEDKQQTASNTTKSKKKRNKVKNNQAAVIAPPL